MIGRYTCVPYERFSDDVCLILARTMSVTWTREVNSWAGECGPFPIAGGWTVLSHEGGGVLRALMFPRQETPSPSCTLYLFACSPIFIRLYLRLESVPLHFLLRSSSSSSRAHRHRFQPLPPPPPSPPPTRHSTFSPPGTDAVTTTCKHSGICNSNAAKRGRKAATEQPEVGSLNFSKTQPRLRIRYSIKRADKDCRENRCRVCRQIFKK